MIGCFVQNVQLLKKSILWFTEQADVAGWWNWKCFSRQDLITGEMFLPKPSSPGWDIPALVLFLDTI
jgi:hypothetical protein